MTNLFKSTATFCGMALLAVGLPVLAQPGPGAGDQAGPDGPGRGPRMMERMAQQLNLSDAQTSQLHAIVARYHSGAFGDTMQSFRDARTHLEGLIGDPAASDEQVLEAARLVSAQGEQAAIQRHRMAVEIDSILTPEQREKAKELKAQGWGKGGHGHHLPADPPQGE